MNKNLVVRVQSSEGMMRVTVSSKATVDQLLKQVQQRWPELLKPFELYTDPQRKKQLSERDHLLTDYGVQNGDLLFLVSAKSGRAEDVALPSAARKDGMDQLAPRTAPVISGTDASIVEDDLDILLYNQSGLVDRVLDKALCRHGEGSKCSHCRPYDVFDPTYIREQGLKYMSFHAYLRQQGCGIRPGVFSLEKTRCTMKKECSNHKPWPMGFCLRCQPPTVTLQRQTYRHVDNISFENSEIGNRLFVLWQKTGCQRFGLLIGRYEPYNEVPLGIRAIVCAIYEPPQRNSPSSIELLPDAHKEKVEELSRRLHCRVVGMIFTDMFGRMDNGRHLIETMRSGDTYLLSGGECIRSAIYQNRYPNACRYSSDGTFGSKFVTVITTGGEDGGVHVAGYQASNQCASLVQADCLVPVIGHPELVQVRESDRERFMPDVCYRKLDSYGNAVLNTARALPVEFLFVDITVGVAKNPQYTFNFKTNIAPFPIENRQQGGEYQTLSAVRMYLDQFSPEETDEMASDFHFLLFLLCNPYRAIEMESIAPLLEAVRTKNSESVSEWFQSNEQWQELKRMIDEENGGPRSGSNNGRGSGRPDASLEWRCPHCTFVNVGGGIDCAICSLPRTF